ncbi:minor tail protein [Gordonia phage Francois]|nr:minor tail protein [Gordonia phage Francois]
MPRVVDPRPRRVADKDPLQGLLNFEEIDLTAEKAGERIVGALDHVRDTLLQWIKDTTGIDLSGAVAFVDWVVEQIREQIGVNLATLQELLENLEVPSLGELLAALNGTYAGDDTILNGIAGWSRNVRARLGGLIDASRIPQLSLAQLTSRPGPNLLSGFGDFADGDTLDGDDVWVWDGAVGHDAPGSARTTADGTTKILTSEAVAVADGQQLECTGWVRWAAASGSGACMQLLIVPFVGDVAQTPVVMSNIVAPPGTSGVSSESTLGGSYVVPAGVTSVRVRLTVEAAMTAGTVWFDDIVLRKTATSLPQQWVSGLTSALSSLGADVGAALEWIRELIAKLTGRVRSSIEDAIADALTFANQLKTLLTGGTVSAPLPSLTDAVALGQGQVSGLPTALNTLHGNVEAVIDGIFQGAANAVSSTGKTLNEAREALLNLFGLADGAQAAALAAQQQLQELTNDTTQPGFSGTVWSQVFGGSDGSPLPAGDWVSSPELVIRDDGFLGIDYNAANGVYYGRSMREFQTDYQSASIVLGSRLSAGDSLPTYVAIRCNDDMTAGVACRITRDSLALGRFTRAGTAITFTPWASTSRTHHTGDLTKIRCSGDNFDAIVNGITRLSYTDSAQTAAKGAGYRRAGVLETKGTPLFVTSTSFRIASFAMADWLPAGVGVTTPSWRLRRGTTANLALEVGHGAIAAMPSSFYTVNDQAVAVTVNDLGAGAVQITEAGWYEIAATSTNLDNSDTGSAIGTQSGLANAYRPTLWVLYVDGTAIAGPIMAGVPTTVYLAAGQVVRPGVSAAWPANATAVSEGGSTGITGGRSNITHVGGGTSASFTGRKVA